MSTFNEQRAHDIALLLLKKRIDVEDPLNNLDLIKVYEEYYQQALHGLNND